MDKASLKQRIHTVIFGSDTPGGKAFDVALFIAIFLSVLVIMLESVTSYDSKYHPLFTILEWIFTILFAIEYILRLYSIRKPWKYALSFYGIIDLLSVLPTFLALIVTGSQMLMTIRILRLLRVFRVLKLTRYMSESRILLTALAASRRKIMVFIFVVFMISIIMGTVMYLVEGKENGFVSIPTSIYWTIVTLTTVGFGDITPQTAIGKAIASFIMILGYGIIAVPTGIVSAQIARPHVLDEHGIVSCPNCSAEGHKTRAKYCYRCGEKLIQTKEKELEE